MKKILSLVIALLFVLSSASVFAESLSDEPDVTAMSIEDWTNYEFHRDYATVFADISSYSHEFLREMLEMHWSTYLALTAANASEQMTEDEMRDRLQKWHDLRETNMANAEEAESKRIYLWPKGQVPTTTEYTVNEGYQYSDWPDFEPYMLEFLVDDSVEPKGAVLIFAGGGYQYRSNVEEGYEVAKALNTRGYQCFVVNYRVMPYSTEEIGLDVTRAVRIVRANAEQYRIDPDKIACAGFSAGGSAITAGINQFMGYSTAEGVVEGYTNDDIDKVNGDINVFLAIYALYSADNLDLEKWPATFLAIGAEDGWDSVSDVYDAIRAKGIQTELHVFAAVPHGFGAGTHASTENYPNAETWPILADVFMQSVYSK